MTATQPTRPGITLDKVAEQCSRGVWYLASPYTHSDAAMMQLRYSLNLVHGAELFRAGVMFAAPIIMTHPMVEYGLPQVDLDFYIEWNKALIEVSVGVIVLMLPGWETSVGVGKEIDYAKELGVPIAFWKVKTCKP